MLISLFNPGGLGPTASPVSKVQPARPDFASAILGSVPLAGEDKANAPSPTAVQANDAANRITESLKVTPTDVRFSANKVTSTREVKILDSRIKDVIYPMPSKVAVECAKYTNKPQGLIIRETT